MKRSLILILLIIPVLCLSASFNAQASIQYDFFFPQQAHLANARFDFLWGNEEGISAGMIGTLGYGFEHFTDYGANALVYGPSISLGPEIRYAFQNGIHLGTSARAVVVYALFPTILRGEVDLDVGYRINGRLSIGLGAGFLFPEKCASVHALVGVRL